MTNKQKLDFKAVLNIVVYGSVVDVPDDEKTEVIDNPPKEDSSNIMNTIFKAFKVLAIIFGVIA
jgi:hypothetical protein